MSTTPIRHRAISPDRAVSDQLQPPVPGDGVERLLTTLQQREMLEPCLLLSTGYSALPWILHQLLLLLSPVAAVLGLSLAGQKESR